VAVEVSQDRIAEPVALRGFASLIGVDLDKAFRYNGDTFPGTTSFAITFRSDHDAIERVIVPPPLQVDREAPPEVTLFYGVNPDSRGFDGRPNPYQFLYIGANVEYEGVRGSTAFEYVDAIYGDKTEVDHYIAWGVYFGMLKKLADIRLVPRENRLEVTVNRRGQRLVTMGLTVGEEVQVQASGANPASERPFLTVRAIPNLNYDGLSELTVVQSPVGEVELKRMWSAHDATLELHSGDLDPLGDLPIHAITGAAVSVMNVSNKNYRHLTAIS
jgi:acetoacetate decarboxylase